MNIQEQAVNLIAAVRKGLNRGDQYRDEEGRKLTTALDVITELAAGRTITVNDAPEEAP